MLTSPKQLLRTQHTSIRLLPRAMHDHVIGPANDLVIARLRRMRLDEVACDVCRFSGYGCVYDIRCVGICGLVKRNAS